MGRTKNRLFFLFSLWVVVEFPIAQATLWDRLKEYRLGLELSEASGTFRVGYETTSPFSLDPSVCDYKGNDIYRCEARLEIDPAPTPGMFFEKPISNDGLWYLDLDLDFSVRRFNSQMIHFTSANDIAPSGTMSPPLKKLQLNLLSFNSNCFLKTGLTPPHPWPSIFVDLGVGLQALSGKVQINHDESLKFMLNSLIYSQITMVLWHFGESGEVSIFSNVELGSSTKADLAIGNMRKFDFDVEKRDSIAIAILTNFP